jgi:hypothetical protein
MRVRLLCAVCASLALILLSATQSGCSKAPSRAVTEEQQPVAVHALPSRQSPADVPLSKNSAPTTSRAGRATPPRGRAIALALDDGSSPSVLDQFEIHK